MNYVIVDQRDNSYFQGLQGWTRLEENAIWYKTKTSAKDVLRTIPENEHMYIREIED